MAHKKVILEALERYVEQKQVSKIREIANQFHPHDLYKLISSWSIDKILFLIRTLKEQQAAELFDEFTTNQQETIIKAFTDTEIGDIFDALYTDEAIDIIEELPAKIVTRILNSVDAEKRKKINKVLKYSSFAVGSRMHVEVVSIKSNQTIGQAKKEIKRKVKFEEKEIAGNIYIHDSEKKFVGYITPEAVLSESNSALVSDYIHIIKPLKVNNNMGEAQTIISEYEIPSVPVVDSKGRLVGAVEADDVIERLEDLEEAFIESSQVTATSKSYLETTIWEIFKSRAMWIVLLILIGSITQIIIVGFQAIWSSTGYWTGEGNIISVTMSTIVTLAFTTAISVSSSINDAAGNTGSQSSSTLVRALALGEVNKGQYGKAVVKETSVGFYLGAVSGVTAFARNFLVWGIMGQLTFSGSDNAGQLWAWLVLISGISSVSFFVAIVIGNFIGAVLPVIAHNRGWDGAVISGPVQTTLVDIITFSIYLGLTTIIFIPLVNAGVFPKPDSSIGTSITETLYSLKQLIVI